MWVKKFAAGVLAAALSLTLLSGCSGGRSGSVISEGETISIDTSASYRLVQYTGNIYLTYELECTNEKDGTKIYAGQANKARCFAGTHEAITMDVKAITSDQYKRTDADGNVIQPGLYTVNYKTKTYKEGGTFGSVEKVLAATAFCNYEKEAGILKEVRAASGTKHKQEYYVRVTSWNSVERANAAMPIVTSVLVLRIRPRISSGIAAIEPNCVSGMIAARSLIGA